MHFKQHHSTYFVRRSLYLLLLTVGLGACSKKDDSPPAQPKPAVSFSVQFASYGNDSWSRNYAEAVCTAPTSRFGALLSFKATPANDRICVLELQGMRKTDLLPGVVGTYDGDGLFTVELSYPSTVCFEPAIAYRNLHGTPYTFTITSYDAATKRASGTFDLNLGQQKDPKGELCPRLSDGQVRTQGTFRDVVLPY